MKIKNIRKSEFILNYTKKLDFLEELVSYEESRDEYVDGEVVYTESPSEQHCYEVMNIVREMAGKEFDRLVKEQSDKLNKIRGNNN